MKYPEYLDPVRLFGVAPFAGAWIEIVFYLIGGVGCEMVAPFAGAWIEMSYG